jgi:hypothetical protein
MDPPLDKVPDGDWFCHGCYPSSKPAPKKARRLASVDKQEATRRRSTKRKASQGKEHQQVDEPEVVEKVEKQATACVKCNLKTFAKKMVPCKQCGKGWHMKCMVPPRTELPEGDWFCADCDVEEPEEAMACEKCDRTTFPQSSGWCPANSVTKYGI